MSEKTGFSLAEYVQEVCEQIVTGVLNAQKSADIGKYIGVGEKATMYDDFHSHVTNVSFDVSAEITSTLGADGKVGITIAGASGKYSKDESATNRISFEVPVAIPLPKEMIEKNKKDVAQSNAALGYL